MSRKKARYIDPTMSSAARSPRGPRKLRRWPTWASSSVMTSRRSVRTRSRASGSSARMSSRTPSMCWYTVKPISSLTKAGGASMASGSMGKRRYMRLIPLSERYPFHLVEVKRLENLPEKAHVTEFLAEVIQPELRDHRGGLGYPLRPVPGGGDADVFVAGELVEEGQEQRLAVEGPGIVQHDHVVAIEARGVGQRPARPNRMCLETGEGVPFLHEILLVLQNLSIVADRVGPVRPEIGDPLSASRRGEDRSVPALARRGRRIHG